MDRPATFEQSYPRYPFAELVRLSIRLGALVADLRGDRGSDEHVQGRAVLKHA